MSTMMHNTQTASQTLFKRLGGQVAINAAVDIFYDKMMKDSRIIPFFAHTNMDIQRAKQKAFLAYAFGGFPNYQGRDMRTVHKRLVEEKGLREEHFNITAAYLKETLEELQLPEELVNEVMAIVSSTKEAVLNL